MRKLIVVGVLAVLGSALLAVPASASFDHHFRVFEKAVSLHPHGQNGFRFRGTLFETRTPITGSVRTALTASKGIGAS